MEIVVITYDSELDETEIDRLFEDRADHYREMPGLLQKYYLRDEKTGRVGGVYVFDGPASRDALFGTDVHATLRDKYQVVGDIAIDKYHVAFPLHRTTTYPSDRAAVAGSE